MSLRESGWYSPFSIRLGGLREEPNVGQEGPAKENTKVQNIRRKNASKFKLREYQIGRGETEKSGRETKGGGKVLHIAEGKARAQGAGQEGTRRKKTSTPFLESHMASSRRNRRAPLCGKNGEKSTQKRVIRLREGKREKQSNPHGPSP